MLHLSILQVVLPFREGAAAFDSLSREIVCAALRAAGMMESLHGVFFPTAGTNLRGQGQGGNSSSSSSSSSSTAYRVFPSAKVGAVLRVRDLHQAQQYLQVCRLQCSLHIRHESSWVVMLPVTLALTSSLTTPSHYCSACLSHSPVWATP